MANLQNLTPFTSDQNREEAAKNGKKGGVASGAARRQKKTIRELAAIMGNTAIQDEKSKAVLAKMGVDAENMSYNASIVAVIIKQALKGNTKNIDQWLELMGEKRTAIDLNGNLNANVKQHSALDELTVDELRKLKALKQEHK